MFDFKWNNERAGIIFAIGMHLDSVYFLVEIVEAVLDDTMGIYELKSEVEKKYELVSLSNIEKFSYEPLQIYCVLGRKCIVLKYSYPFL